MFIKHKDIGKLLKVIIFVVTLYLFYHYNPVQGHYINVKKENQSIVKILLIYNSLAMAIVYSFFFSKPETKD